MWGAVNGVFVGHTLRILHELFEIKVEVHQVNFLSSSGPSFKKGVVGNRNLVVNAMYLNPTLALASHSINP
ncbi:unnamed protein product [Calypogeia fissa]